MQFGDMTFLGQMKQDDVCLSNFEGGAYCAYQFPFFLIGSQVAGQTQNFDGILGLGPASY